MNIFLRSVRLITWRRFADLIRRSIVFWTLLVLISCASYYQKNFNFNQAFERGDLRGALTTLERSNGDSRGRNRFLYYANMGLLGSILGDYDESNRWLEKAFLFGEDYRLNYLNEAASYLTNPNFTVYRGEDHEHLMVLYLKAINYLKMNKPDEALVECRRLSIRLNQLSDKYVSEQKFQRDAFVHTLMGIIYQSTRDYNNAFIAYRNAAEIYESDYARMFAVAIPEQLKKDLINTAFWTGFQDEYEYYKAKFCFESYTPASPESELVFFWHNGLTPVKGEWSINFVMTPQGDNVVVFHNDDMNLAFPFPLESDKDKSDLSSLKVFRVAFPRYIERPLYFQSAALTIDNVKYPLEIAEDVNKVAFYSLKQRMLQEFTKGLLRAALEKVTEQSLRKEDDRLGAVIGLVNAVTEKADTRNWQTLPHSIYYARIPLHEGENKINFQLEASDRVADHSFTYQVKKGQTLFHTFSSLERRY